MRKQKSKAAFALERCRSSYEEICWTAYNNMMLVPEALRTRSFWLMACKADGRALYAVPPELVDAELCRAAVDGAPEALRHVPPELIDEEMCRKAVSAMPEMLACVPDQLCTAELCLEAVTKGARVSQQRHIACAEVCASSSAHKGPLHGGRAQSAGIPAVRTGSAARRRHVRTSSVSNRPCAGHGA